MPHKLTDQQVTEAHSRYLNGELQQNLCREYFVSRKTLQNEYKRLGLPKRYRKNPNCDRLTYDLEAAYKEYINGKPLEKIALELKITPRALVTRFSKKGFWVFPACRREVIGTPAGNFNPVQTEEAAYWLGFLMADGCLLEHKGKTRTTYAAAACSSIKDKEHLEKLARFLGGNLYDQGKVIQVVSQQSGEWAVLKDFNFGGKKARRLTLPKIREDLVRHLIRGFFDGDGNIWVSKDLKEASCSFYSVGPTLIKDISDYLLRNGINSKSYIQTTKAHKINERILAHSSIGKLMVIRRRDLCGLQKLLYASASVYLPRKRDKFEKLDATPC
jgi:intein/homing endonuclease